MRQLPVPVNVQPGQYGVVPHSLDVQDEHEVNSGVPTHDVVVPAVQSGHSAALHE